MEEHSVIFAFNEEKDAMLKARFGLGFREIIALITAGDVIDVIDHPKPDKYPNQQVYILDVDGYVYMVQFVKEEKKRFLKTFYPSRKATKIFLKEIRHGKKN